MTRITTFNSAPGFPTLTLIHPRSAWNRNSPKFWRGVQLCAPVARSSPPYRGALYTPLSRLTPTSYRSKASSNSWCQNSCKLPSSMSTSRARYSGWPHLPLIVPVSPRHSGRSPDLPTRTLTPIRACSGLTSLAPLPPLSADRLSEWQVDSSPDYFLKPS
jgi:hypothetical protein